MPYGLHVWTYISHIIIKVPPCLDNIVKIAHVYELFTLVGIHLNIIYNYNCVHNISVDLAM